MHLRTRPSQLVTSFVAGALLFLSPSVVSAATYTVTTPLDSGPGTLRQAVLDANANPGADTIDFDASVFNGLPTIGFLAGEMVISGPLTIDGPPNRVVLSGNNANRMFRIDDGTGSGITVIFRKLRFYSGKVFGNERGGAILVANENLSCTDCQFNSNTSQDAGGAINYTGGVPAFLTLTRCTFSLNEATTAGGAFSAYGIVITSISDCTFSGNRAASGGVINQNAGGQLVITGSSFYENTSTGYTGGIFLNSGFGQAIIRNSTFSGNVSGNDGGAITLGSIYSPSIDVQNCTIANNSCNGSGGAIARILGGNAVINLNSCILWGNSAGNTGPALYTTGTVNANACLIQSSVGVTTFGGDAFTLGHFGVNPLISPLANNGGLTLTHLLQYGSPAIDNGQNPAGLTTDQRGGVFVRAVDGDCNNAPVPDIGAFEAHICNCPGDTNEDGMANIDDILLVIGSWGYSGTPGGILADATNDGHVDIDDLLAVINGWGVCR